MRKCDAAEKRKPLFLSNISKVEVGENSKTKVPKKAYLILNISFRKGHPYYTPKL